MPKKEISTVLSGIIPDELKLQEKYKDIQPYKINFAPTNVFIDDIGKIVSARIQRSKDFSVDNDKLINKIKMKKNLFAKCCFMLIILSFFQLFTLKLFAQNAEKDSVKIGSDNLRQSFTEVVIAPSTSVYLELGGKGVYSINVDFRKRRA